VVVGFENKIVHDVIVVGGEERLDSWVVKVGGELFEAFLGDDAGEEDAAEVVLEAEVEGVDEEGAEVGWLKTLA